MSTLTPTQRERLLAALGARQAEEGTEEAPDYLQLLPEAPEPPRWTLRDWFAARLNRYVLYECWTGRPATPGHTCDECEKRAAKRHDRFWGILELLAVAGILVYGLWVWRPQ
jgi:hypothetical protein